MMLLINNIVEDNGYNILEGTYVLKTNILGSGHVLINFPDSKNMTVNSKHTTPARGASCDSDQLLVREKF